MQTRSLYSILVLLKKYKRKSIWLAVYCKNRNSLEEGKHQTKQVVLLQYNCKYYHKYLDNSYMFFKFLAGL